MYGKTNAGASTGATNSGVEMVKLWENASPTSDFAAQTIALPLGEDAMFLVKLKLGRDGIYAKTSWQFCDLSTTVLVAQVAHLVEDYSPTFAFRGCVVTTTGIQFMRGAYKAPGGAAPTYMDNYCIPLEIWLLKGGGK